MLTDMLLEGYPEQQLNNSHPLIDSDRHSHPFRHRSAFLATRSLRLEHLEGFPNPKNVPSIVGSSL